MRACCWCFILVLGCTLLALPCTAQSHASNPPPPQAARGEVLVRFREVTTEKLRGLARAHDLDRSHRLGGVERLYRFHSRSKNAETLLREFSARADVLYAEPNFVVDAVQQPNDPRFAELWALHNSGQSYGFPAGTPGADIGALEAWGVSTGAAGHVVAVIDTGMDYTHPDLQANAWSAPSSFSVALAGSTLTCPAGSHGFNAITFACDPMDDNQHGTHVSGTIGAAGDNALGVVGVNWTTRMMGIKFLDASGSGYVSDAVNAIEFAVQAKQALGAGADVRVLSNSWGGSGFSQALLDEIKRAGDNGMLFVVAAGNNGYDNDRSPFYPAAYNVPSLIAVAATDNRDALASFSNYGAAGVHLGAPGVNILSTVLSGQYGYLSGTSMATPHVSGAAALLLSRCALDTAGLKAALTEQVDLVPALSGITASGGRLNVNRALRDCTAPVGISPGALAFGRQVVNTAGSPRTVTLTNHLSDPVTVTGVTASGDFLVNHACSQLSPRGTCPISVSYSPTALGYLEGALTVAHTAAGSPLTVQLSGYSVAATTVTPLSITFPGVVLGASSSPGYIILTNNQAAPLVIGDIATSGAFTQTNNCGAALAATLSCNILVTFTPTALGAHSGTLTLNHDAATSPQTVVLAGTGVARATLTPAALDFGGIVVGSASPARTASLRNNQKGAALLISSIVAAGDFTQSNTCGAQLAPAFTCAIRVNFKPSAMGLRTGSITIADNTPESPRVLLLSGTGMGQPDLAETSVSALGELAVGGSAPVSDTASNRGAGTAGASVTRYYLSSTPSAVPAGTRLSATRAVPALDAGASSSGTVTVSVSPYFVPGSYYLLACADDTRSVIESNESNNCVSSSSPLPVNGPDLVETSVVVNSSLVPGGTASVTDTTVNRGLAGAGTSTTRYYLSNTPSSVPAGSPLTGSRAVPALAAGASSTGTATLTVSPYTPPGSYYVLACADGYNYVAESNENNNCAASALVRVGAP